jgi:hypothetical protein
MKRALFAAGLIVAMALPHSAHAAGAEVRIAGFQYISSGFATVDPLNLTEGAGTVQLPTGTPLDRPTVTRGSSVTFTNVDPVPHTVTKVSGPASTWTSFQLGIAETKAIPIGATFATGTYTYRCALHLGMRGQFTVA